MRLPASRGLTLISPFVFRQLNTEWAQVEVIDLVNDGTGLGFGIIGGRSTGVVVKTILPGGVADRVSHRPRIHEQKISKVSNRYIRYVKQTEILTHATHVNGWEPAVYYHKKLP